jgi:hypothetical protein
MRISLTSINRESLDIFTLEPQITRWTPTLVPGKEEAKLICSTRAIHAAIRRHAQCFIVSHFSNNNLDPA